MDARLVALDGPLGGQEFPLVAAETFVGREAVNAIAIPDSCASRRHCVVVREGDRYILRDLESRNGTFVQGVPVREHALEPGDEIQIGRSVFVFLRGHERLAPGGAVEEAHVLSHTSVVLRREDAIYVSPGKVAAALPDQGVMARNLKVLLDIGAAIPAIRGLEALQRRLMELIGEALPAEEGAILLGAGIDELTSAFFWSREPESVGEVRVSRTVVERVLRERVSILSKDVPGDPGLPQAESLLGMRIRSVLAVPLIAFDESLGAIFLSSRAPAAAFDENHLQLLTGIAGIAAGALDAAERMDRLEKENRRLQAEVNIEHNMVGDSPRLRQVLQAIAKVAPATSTVLIRGESGVGKELAARAIHRNSPRSNKPFVAVNCAALTETLLESEMFGHERGAFTGAVVQKRGKLEEANGGSVFLDEVGEMPAALQVKLLRVLQEREFERVGGNRAIKTDIRLIAATNRDLEEMVRNGFFRQDLYYRLNVISITMPPLRERVEDIPLLAAYFIQKHARVAPRRVKGISEKARACLLHYDWPGNIRELENVVERALVLGVSEVILPDDLPETIVEATTPAAAGDASGDFHEAVKEAKRQIVLHAIERSASLAEAARVLGLHPNNLHRLIRTLNLRPSVKAGR
ncbi:MAG: sigma 54-interacting transcriptional regulator [Bryobacteraceae bacterium]|nr:sigma 54-interacting transcriptional regulator [Bryobacteraceae bacterium]